jgi:hypothetical protein
LKSSTSPFNGSACGLSASPPGKTYQKRICVPHNLAESTAKVGEEGLTAVGVFFCTGLEVKVGAGPEVEAAACGVRETAAGRPVPQAAVITQRTIRAAGVLLQNAVRYLFRACSYLPARVWTGIFMLMMSHYIKT